MNTEEVRLLLPFFVAGTLEPVEQKKVEEAIAGSRELQEDLALWQRTAGAVAQRAEEPIHPAAEQIADRALRRLSPELVPEIDRHLQLCPSCTEEFRRVLATVESLKPADGVDGGTSIRTASVLRMRYLIPATAAALGILAFFILRPEKGADLPSPGPAGTPFAVEQPAASDSVALLHLTYRPDLRSGESGARSTPVIERRGKKILLVVAIPHNALEGIRYNVTLSSDGSTATSLGQVLSRSAAGGVYDTLRFTLSIDALPARPGPMTLSIHEILPARIFGVTPEVYRFDVEIQNAR